MHGRDGSQLRLVTAVLLGVGRHSSAVSLAVPPSHTVVADYYHYDAGQQGKRVTQGGMEITQSIHDGPMRRCYMLFTAHHPFALLNTKGWLAEPGCTDRGH